MGAVWTEIRFAARSLARSPAVSLCAILCLGLGIGATTAISSALSRALLQPLPFRAPDRLVSVHRITPQSGPMGGWSQSVPNYIDLRDRSKQITGLAAITWGSSIINLPDDAIQARQSRVTGNLFQTLGTRAQRGRLLMPDDDRLDATLVAVMSDELWRSRFGADTTVVGRTLIVDGQPTTIVGISPIDFRVPIGAQLFRSDLWTPIRFTDQQRAARRSNNLQTLGRLADGATVQGAEAELRAIFASLIAENPQLRGDNVRVAALQSENTRSIRKPLLLLFGAVVIVLLISATNVAALLFARGVQKQRELAVRSALGASSWDTMRPALVESGLLTAVSVLVGLALAAVGVKTIGLLAASRISQLNGLSLNPAVLAFALVLSSVAALVCGAAPAWRSTKVDPQDALRSGRGGGSDKSHQRALKSLVVLEISLSLVLLIGAGLVLKGFARLLANDPGFDPSRILTLQISTSPTRYPDGTSVRDFVEPALAAMRLVPGVEDAAAISAVPYITWGNNSGTRYEGAAVTDQSRLPITEMRGVTPGFFGVTKQRLVSGRLLTSTDDERPSSPTVVVVNEALVKRDFPGRDPVGRRFHLSDTTFATIVGVVSDIRNFGPISPPAPEMYWNYRQWGSGTASVQVMVRVASGDPSRVTPGLRDAVRSIDANAAVSSVATMNTVIARSLGSPRFYFTLLGTFAAIAMALALTGLYGVLSYAVAQRTREIGIRSALGSTRSGIVGLVTRDALKLVAAGVVLGLFGGIMVTRLMESMLYGTSPLDVSTWLLAVLLMITAAMAAALIPARRASKVDPLIAIQTE
jgi:putative ABC transport system permease protein